jgi:hypothetical protein
MTHDDLGELRKVVENGGGTLEIDSALAPVAAGADPQTITPLLLMLRETNDDDGMWSIVHAAEQFDHSTYLLSFLAALPDMAPYWASITTMRVLNSDETRAELIRRLDHSSALVKDAVRRVCEGISEGDPAFMAKTTPVLAAIH